MKKSLGIHILTRNSAKNILRTIQSVHELGTIHIADAQSSDDTVKLCRSQGCNVSSFPFTGDFSKIRNDHIRTITEETILWLEPGETIFEEIELAPTRCGAVLVHREDSAVKEIRLFDHSAKFVNPVFETIKTEVKPEDVSLVVVSKWMKDLAETKKICENWMRSSPLAADAAYYSAMCEWMSKNWDEFLMLAEKYLFRIDRNEASTLMIRYLAATVLVLIKKDYSKALQWTLSCLSEQPRFAEFWCLLGDIHAAAGNPSKAIVFYQNALAMTGYRKIDTFPIEVSKYSQYPTLMIGRCADLLNTAVKTAFPTH